MSKIVMDPVPTWRCRLDLQHYVDRPYEFIYGATPGRSRDLGLKTGTIDDKKLEALIAKTHDNLGHPTQMLLRHISRRLAVQRLR